METTDNIGNKDTRGYTLTNVLDPADAQDVATKQYVDEANINFKKKLIAAHASYHGDLIKGDYQFTFGGSKKHDIFNGFLMPWGGYIKRFVLEPTGFKFSNDKYTNFSDLLSGSSKVFQIPAFTLVVVNITGEVVDLGTLFVGLDIFFFGFTYSGEKSPYGNDLNPIYRVRWKNIKLMRGIY